MNLVKWMRNLVRKRPRAPHIEPTRLYTLEDWNRAPDNAKALDSFLRGSVGRKLLAVWQSSRPRGYPLRGGATVESAALEHMRREGYESLWDLTLLMTARQDDREQVEADFGADEPGEPNA